MSKTLYKNEILEKMYIKLKADNKEVTRKDVKVFLDSMYSVFKEWLETSEVGDKFQLTDFFQVKKFKSTEITRQLGKDPEARTYGGNVRVRFRGSKAFAKMLDEIHKPE